MHTREPGTRSEPVRFTPADEQTMLEAAGAAPSVHNSQPWRFVIRPGSIEVLADPSRQLRYADSVGRSLLISCGAALFNLRVAAEHVGYHPRVRLLPDPGDPTLVGRLTFTHRHGRPGTLDALFPSVAVRRTNRAPFRNLALPATVLGRLAEAAQVENTALRIYSDPDEVARVVTLLHEAEVDEDRDPDRFVERAHVNWTVTLATGQSV